MSFYYDEYRDQIIDGSGQRFTRPPEMSVEEWRRNTSAIPRSMPHPQPFAGDARRLGARPMNSYSLNASLTPPQTTNFIQDQQSAYSPRATNVRISNRRYSNTTHQPWNHHQLPSQFNSLSVQSQQSLPPPSPTASRVSEDSKRDSVLRTYNGSLANLEENKRLYSSFKRAKKPRKFFQLGKVFVTLWAEPAGERGQGSSFRRQSWSGISTGSFGESVFSKIRRFVVVREGDESCTALMIKTYNSEGVSRKGVRKAAHAVIHTGKKPPALSEKEVPQQGEQGLLQPPIRVDADDPAEKLDELSRVDFGKVYTVEHNVKVRSLGKLNRDSVEPFLEHMESVSSRLTASWSTRGAASYSADWTLAHSILLNNGWSDARARAILKSDAEADQDVAGHVQSYDHPIDANRLQHVSQSTVDQNLRDVESIGAEVAPFADRYSQGVEIEEESLLDAEFATSQNDLR